MKNIYFDNGASSHPKPPSVYENVLNYIVGNGANAGRSSHELAMAAAETVYNARKSVAAFFGMTSPENVVFTLNATHGLNTVIQGLFSQGMHVITTDLEHNSVLRPLYEMQKRGIKLDVVTTDLYDDDVTVQRIDRLIRPETKGIVVTQCSNVCGKMLPLKKIAALMRPDMRLIVDGSQGAGSIPTDIVGNRIDYYCAPSHKGMLGIQGCGFILCRHNELRPLLFGGTGGDSERRTQPSYLPDRLEAGTLPIPAISSLLEGVKFIEKVGIHNLYTHKKHLVRTLYYGLLQNPLIEVCADYDRFESPGVISFNVRDKNSEEIGEYLSREGIAVRSGLHCAPLFHNKMGTADRGMVRVSFGFMNTELEVLKLLKVLNFLKF